MDVWLREREGEKWREKKRDTKRLAALLQPGASAQHYFTLSVRGSPPANSPASSWRSLTKTPFVLTIIALTSSQLWSCINVSTGKIQVREKQGLDTERGRRMMRSLKKKPAFPDQAVWLCDARKHRVCVSLHVWNGRCNRLNGRSLKVTLRITCRADCRADCVEKTKKSPWNSSSIKKIYVRMSVTTVSNNPKRPWCPFLCLY